MQKRIAEILQSELKFIEIGDGKNHKKYHSKNHRKIATLRGEGKSPSLFWLGGYKSDMEGSKAAAVANFGRQMDMGVTRFDYSGHGKSSGEFIDGDISYWLEETLAVFDQTSGGQIIIGSSMGGWLALLLNNILRSRQENRVKAIILIAPAVDMSEELMKKNFSAEQLLALENQGFVEQPSDYDEPYIITRQLIEDGKNHLLFGKPIIANCPVFILQGALDKAVPVSHTLKLLSHMMLDPVFFTLVPDGDHSLSRQSDLDLLKNTIEQAVNFQK